MPGYLLHVGAKVTCFDGGPADPAKPNTNVTVSGQPTVLLPTQYTIPSCPLKAGSSPFCTVGTWTSGTTKVTSNGQPLVISTGVSTSVANSTPMQFVSSQTKVTAS